VIGTFQSLSGDMALFLSLEGSRLLVPSREWLEFEGGVISALFQPTESALSRRWRSRHENGYHKIDGGRGRLLEAELDGFGLPRPA
jgi:hypothetical protein